jgi:hypothetical protein
VDQLAPQIHAFVASPSRDSAEAGQNLWRYVRTHPCPVSDLTANRALELATALRRLHGETDQNRKIALWALYNSPPQELVSYPVIQTGGWYPLGFGRMQPLYEKNDFQAFKAYLELFIERHHGDPDFNRQISAIRTEWLKKLAFGEVAPSEEAKVQVAGIGAALEQVIRVLPGLLLALYIVYCALYMRHLDVGAGGVARALDFPTFGRLLSGRSPSGKSTSSEGLGWLIHASLPIGIVVLTSFFVGWPSYAGHGSDFLDQICVVAPYSGDWLVDCRPEAITDPIVALSALALTILVIRRERTAGAFRGGATPSPLERTMQIVCILLAALALQIVWMQVSTLSSVTGPYFVRSINLWFFAVPMIALNLFSPAAAWRFTLLATGALAAMALAGTAIAVQQPTQDLVSEGCYGPACYID